MKGNEQVRRLTFCLMVVHRYSCKKCKNVFVQAVSTSDTDMVPIFLSSVYAPQSSTLVIMHLHHFESPEDEDKPFDMEEPNFFGVSIAYDPYMREVVKAEQFTTCGGDGGRSICGGLGIFLGFLPCSPHCKPEVQEDKELNGDYDFYRPIIRVDVN